MIIPIKGTIVPILGIIEHLDMTVISMGDALFTKTQKKVLGLLFGKPDKSFYTNEIMRWASMGRGTVGRELDKLVSVGLLTVTREGNHNYYQANENNPIYSELVSIVRKTFGVADVVREVLVPFDNNIELAFIYGSIAKGLDTKSSDIDLMLVGNGLNYGLLMEVLLPLEEALQRSINPTIYDKNDFSNKLKESNSFLTRVMEQPKIMIKGVINDVGKPSED